MQACVDTQGTGQDSKTFCTHTPNMSGSIPWGSRRTQSHEQGTGQLFPPPLLSASSTNNQHLHHQPPTQGAPLAQSPHPAAVSFNRASLAGALKCSESAGGQRQASRRAADSATVPGRLWPSYLIPSVTSPQGPNTIHGLRLYMPGRVTMPCCTLGLNCRTGKPCIPMTAPPASTASSGVMQQPASQGRPNSPAAWLGSTRGSMQEVNARQHWKTTAGPNPGCLAGYAKHCWSCGRRTNNARLAITFG